VQRLAANKRGFWKVGRQGLKYVARGQARKSDGALVAAERGAGDGSPTSGSRERCQQQGTPAAMCFGSEAPHQAFSQRSEKLIALRHNTDHYVRVAAGPSEVLGALDTPSTSISHPAATARKS